MKLVIDIHEKDYTSILNRRYVSSGAVDAIMHGTPLPKGHGRLIDADALKSEIRQWQRDISNPEARRGARLAEAHYQDLINKSPTIIETDKEEE